MSAVARIAAAQLPPPGMLAVATTGYLIANSVHEAVSETPRYGDEDVSATINGVRVHHRRPGPWQVQKFNSGFACVMNANGINWTYAPACPGATLFTHEDADLAAAALNEAGEPT